MDGQEQRQRQRRVLLVDDHADTRDMLVRLLSRSYEVATAECFDSAIASAQTQTPDIVITDVGLPGRDGITLMRELRERYGVRGIAVTGHTGGDPAVYREAGFVHWLTKPIHLEELLTTLQKACAEESGAVA
jgi:CheY-like chemotaxis protein